MLYSSPMSRRWLVTLSLTLVLVTAWQVRAAVTLAQKLSGRILNQVQAKGALWYVYPVNKQRYYLGDQANADKVLRKLSLGVSAANLALIPVAGDTSQGNLDLRRRLSGRILRDPDGALWYLSPLSLQRAALTDPSLTIIRKFGLGITNTNLATIPVASGYDAPRVPPRPVNGLLRTQRTVVTSRGSFVVDQVALDLSVTTLKVMTDTAQTVDCTNGCTTLGLKSYSDRRRAALALHGSYFCPREYASCIGQTGSYYYPVYNSFSRVMINDRRIKYTPEPLIAFDTKNKPYFYAHAKDFINRATFEAKYGVTLRSLIGNGPALMIAGKNVANPAAMDRKQATVKSFRGAIGWKGTTLYLLIVRGATVPDAASVTQAMGLDYAMNLDGGGSTALVQNGGYIVGPGRNIPNAILLVP